MADEKKSRPRRGRPRGAAAASGSKQKSIKDMFGGGGSKGDPATVSQTRPVIDLVDTPDIITGEVETTSGVDPPTVEGTDSKPPPPRTVRPQPKKLFPLFEKHVEPEPSSSRPSPPEVIHILDEEPPRTLPAPPKNVHPFFSRTTSFAPKLGQTPAARPDQDPGEGSSRDIPIVIESSPQTRISALPKVSKPVHSIFNRRPLTEPHHFSIPSTAHPPPYPDAISQHVTGSRTNFPRPDRFFPRRNRNIQYSLEDVLMIPYPTQSIDNLAWLRSADNSSPSDSASPSFSTYAPQAHDISTYIDTIPRPHQAHPSISHLIEHVEAKSRKEVVSTSTEDLWVSRWRPRRAEEVLGNEESASYLKHWMTALKLHHEHQSMTPPVNTTSTVKRPQKRKPAKSKRPDVVRHVNKRRKLMDEYDEDFLAPSDFSDTEEEDIRTAPSSDFDDFTFCQDTLDRLNGLPTTDSSCPSSPSAYDIRSENQYDSSSPLKPLKAPRFGRQIRNTILLTGPSGIGKTAAVYACASELGWDVFEVYPGIGERSGAELNKLIGDVGKNHMVKVTHQPSPRKAKAKVDFFQAGKGKMKTARRVESDDESIDIDIFSVTPTPTTIDDDDIAAVPGEPTVNQSVILIEEVDILYQTDANFWPALINIIKECRRPVILTCNDILRVPCLDLPLQTTLHFVPCPVPLAASYLQALCLVEGAQVRREDLVRLYDGDDLQDEPHCPDLRHSITRLQFLLANARERTVFPETSPALPAVQNVPVAPQADISLSSYGGISEMVDTVQRDAVVLGKMARTWDSMSFIDSYLSRESSAHLGDIFADELGSSSDDLLGYKVLDIQANTDCFPISAFYHQDMYLCAQALELVQRVAAGPSSADMPTYRMARSLDVTRSRYHAQVGPILRQPVSEAPARPWRVSISQEALHLDYAPWIRYIVAADDAVESASQPASQGRRFTRNSLKTSQDRWLKLEVDQRRTLSQTSLRLEDLSTPSP